MPFRGRGGYRSSFNHGGFNHGGFHYHNCGFRRNYYDDYSWVPLTKLGRLVKQHKIRTIEEVFLHSLPIKEHQIVDELLPHLKSDVLKITTVQKQTRGGQRTRFKAFVVVGDRNGHVGLGIKCSKEVATAVRGAFVLAKMSVVPVRRGFWSKIVPSINRGPKPLICNYDRNNKNKNIIGNVHTVPFKITGECGSVRVRMMPAPRGTGIVAAEVVKKLVQFAGIEDVYTSTTGSTKSYGDFVKATFDCFVKSYRFLTPDLWNNTSSGLKKSRFHNNSDLLIMPVRRDYYR